jgi:hypothetical protein
MTARTVDQLGWARYVQEARGKSNLADTVRSLPHKAARLLEHLRKRGASVVTTLSPWGATRCDDAVSRGPHKSSHTEREFVATEILDFCAQGYWAVLPYQHVRHWRGLRISPMGVVPQRDRRPRLIVDYSFSGVNEDTVLLAPRESMQFGRALQRVMSYIVHADPRYGPVYLAKIDIADGFYRVWIQTTDIAKLGVALPTAPGMPPLVAFPLALPMGWVESPPYFTAITETACDLANATLRRRAHVATTLPVHRLETVSQTPPPADSAPRSAFDSLASRLGTSARHKGRPPVATVDVYVDDFLLLAQTAPQRRVEKPSGFSARARRRTS